MTHEQAFRRYRGFDGHAWPESGASTPPLVGGLAAPSDLHRTLSYWGALGGRNECDIVGLSLPGCAEVPRSWRRLGIDVGYFASEWNHYSCLLNEVVFAALEELRCFEASLNADLLLDDVAAVGALLAKRTELRAAGADLETGPETIDLVVVHELPLAAQGPR